MQTVKTVFPNEEAFQEIYEECLESIPQASEAIKNGRREMDRVFEAYLTATEEWMFRHAYQCGYEAAVKALQKGGVTV